MENVSEKAVWLNWPWAEKLGLKFPQAIIAEATRASAGVAATNPPAQPSADLGPLGPRAKIDLLEYIETPNVEINRDGGIAGLDRAGLNPGVDYEVPRMSPAA